MTYNPLSQDSGGDAIARREEANRIIKIIRDIGTGQLSEKEQTFLNEASHQGTVITVKMIFWLRDIKDKL